jgi:hypothetical protein
MEKITMAMMRVIVVEHVVDAQADLSAVSMILSMI